ncbi:MAG: hypothetical protein ACI9WU_000918 [Myxococcota bacterium]
MFALSTGAVDAMATLIPVDEGGTYTGAQLAEEGFIPGLFLDEAGQPVAGVTLINTDGEPVEGTHYPNANGSGLDDDITAAHGAFVLASAPLKSYTGPKEGWTFAQQQGASSGGGVFLLTLVGAAD